MGSLWVHWAHRLEPPPTVVSAVTASPAGSPSRGGEVVVGLNTILFKGNILTIQQACDHQPVQNS